MSRTAFLETLASVAGIVPNAIAEPFHRWHEDDLTAKLYETAMKLLRDPEKLQSMRRALTEIAVVDAAERIVQTVKELVKAP